MSSNGAELLRLAARGERVQMVREAAKMSGDEFADAINEKAARFGVAAGYDKTKVSRLEAGKQTFLPAEHAVVIAQIDPEDRGVQWLVFGGPKVARAKRVG